MTPTVFLLGIVFLLSSPAPTSTVSIDLTLRLRCKEGYSNWCANVYVIEEDFISPHDFVAARNECISGNGKDVMKMTFGVIRLGGDTTPSYEIMPIVSHNCSKDGSWYCAKPNSAFDVQALVPAVMDLQINLSETGDKKGRCKY